MGAETYNKQTITQYLLGILPEAETERFDELSVTDDEFADALSVAESELVDAYVHGELAADAAEQFKTRYMASPLRSDKVEFARVFQGWSEKSAIEQSHRPGTRAAGDSRKDRGWFAGLGIFGSSRPALQWAFAASALALLVVVGLLVFQNMRLRQQMTNEQARHDQLLQRERELQKEIEAQRSASAQTEQELARVRDEREKLEQELKTAQQGGIKSSAPAEGSIVSLILAPPLRGVGKTPTVSIPPGANLVASQLQLEIADHSAYRVALIDPGTNQTLWRSGNLKLRPKGERKVIAVSFPAGLLKPRHYILRVAGVSRAGSSENVGDYPFKVVK